MVGTFAALKWRLVSSRIRAASGGTKAWLIVGWCVAVVVLVGIGLLLALLRSQPSTASTVVITLFTVQLLAWVLGPLVAFGIDETVDPSRFALLPLTIGTLQRGLLVASLVGYLPAANALILIGAAIALSSTWALLPVALLCAAAQLLLCVVISRAASAAMSGLMAGRRGRDLGMVIGSLLFFGYLILSFVLNQTASSAARNDSGIGGGFTSVSRVLAYGPNGALAAIPAFVADRNWARLVVAVFTVAVVLVVAWWWWSTALRKSLTTMPSTTEGSAPVAVVDAERTARLPVANSLSGMIALVIARDRVLAWRDPMRRIPWFLLAGLAVLWPFLVIRGHGSLFAVAFPALIVGLQAGNQYGVEGTGVWLHMVAFADRTRARGEALGHAIFAVIPGTIVIVIAVFVHATVRHDLHLVPAALGVCLGLMLGSVAVTGYTSARLPYAMRQSRKSMFANSIPGQKGRTTAASLAGMGGALLVGAPAIVLAILSGNGSPALGWAALVVGPICGAIAVAALSGVTATTYLSRMPEILAVVAIGDRS